MKNSVLEINQIGRRRLSRKIVVSVVVVVTFFISVVSLSSSLYSIVKMKKNLRKHGLDLVKTFSSSNLESLMSADYPFIMTSAENLMKSNPDVLCLTVLDPQKNVIIRLGEEASGDEAVVIQEPIKYKNRLLGWSKFVLSTKLLKPHIFWRTISIIGVGLLIVILTSGVLIVLLKKMVISPVQELYKFADRLRSGILDYRVDLKGGDELESLGEMLNEMARQLQLSKIKLEEEKELLEMRVKQRTNELSESLIRLKTTQSSLLQSSKMAAVGQLAAGIAHEINNPLGVILGFSQSIKSQLQNDEAVNMGLEFIEKEAIRCKDLVQNLLIFSRTSRTEQWEEIDIKSTIEDALSLVTAQSRVKNVEMVREFEDNLPKILANSNQIQQVIINLCNNAIDAMDGGGKITLQAGQTVRNGTNWITLKVSDTGSGIPKEIQSKIFEPFFTTKEVGKGTGLGLSLIYEIVQKHKGTIELESEVGKGTVFKIFFPVQPGDVEKAA